MLKIDPTVRTIGLAAMIAIAGGFGINVVSTRGESPFLADTARAQSAAMEPQWAASATGRVEPKSGEVDLASQVPNRLVEVLAASNDNVKKGDLLLRVDDQELYVKRTAALQEESVRVREREEEKATGVALERRNAEDAVAKAEREVFDAQEAFDSAYRAMKTSGGASDAVDQARDALQAARDKLDQQHAALAKVNAKPNMPDYQRLESSLAAARAELSATEIAIERTRVRAPMDGTVLDIDAKVGELAVPSPQNALVKFGDMSALRVRAEVEERDATKIAVGQKVIIKADAFPGKEFTGKVASISRSLTSPHIPTLGPRRPMDVEVVEAMVDLDGTPPLFNGMRVDVFFEANASSNTAEAVKTN
jgi:HlyD family secretion protein